MEGQYSGSFVTKKEGLVIYEISIEVRGPIGKPN
jgi:hypothetical protein